MNINLKEIANNTNSIGWLVLDLLRKEQLTFMKLRSELELSQDKTYKELARLEGGLLISTERDPKDQRVALYSLTKYGKAVFDFKE
ncbi:hypothetical protein [Cytobacillus kochii]|uniref:hypothetical protein n=1 Tax=Cytobacillus kochii TaxID=859143 RepID=UPI00247FE6CF|nr:hypothetical protein [Cytobacillus kochii]